MHPTVPVPMPHSGRLSPRAGRLSALDRDDATTLPRRDRLAGGLRPTASKLKSLSARPNDRHDRSARISFSLVTHFAENRD